MYHVNMVQINLIFKKLAVIYLSNLTSALYQPNGIFLVAGRHATQMENNDIKNDAKSVNKCAASVATAKLFDK